MTSRAKSTNRLRQRTFFIPLRQPVDFRWTERQSPSPGGRATVSRRAAPGEGPQHLVRPCAPGIKILRRGAQKTAPRMTGWKACPTKAGVHLSIRARRTAVIACALIAAWAAMMAAGCQIRRPPNDHARQQILYTSVGSDPQTFNPILITDAVSGELLSDRLRKPGAGQSGHHAAGAGAGRKMGNRARSEIDHVSPPPRCAMVRRPAAYGARCPLHDAVSSTIRRYPTASARDF